MKTVEPIILERVKIGLLLILTASLLLPFIQFTSILVLLLVGISLFHFRSLKLRNLKFSNWVMLYYGMLIVGVAYTENRAEGFKVLEGTASFLAFPIIFMSKELLSVRIKKYVIDTFLLATSLFCFYTYIKSLFYPKEFFYNNTLTFDLIHHSYFGLFCSFAILVVLVKLVKAKSIKIKAFYAFLILFLSFYLLLLGARTSLFATLIATIIFLLFTTAISSKLKKYTGTLLILFLCVGALIISGDKKLKYRYYHLLEKSLDNRVNLWQASLSVIEENPIFGVGTGDASTELLKEYEQRKLSEPFTRKYNAHNQYLDSTIRIGIIGSFPLALYLLSSLYLALKDKELLHIVFLCIFIIACFTEVLLIRQKGIVFFMLFNTLFLVTNKKKKENNYIMSILKDSEELASKEIKTEKSI